MTDKKKAAIVVVGTIEDNQPRDFTFDCRGVVPPINIREDGEVLWGGYTVDELKAIASGRTGKERDLTNG